MRALPRFVLLLVLSALTACSKSSEPSYLKKHVGEECVVEFRRDALGSAAPLPVSPKTDGINGADVVQAGKLQSVDEKGLVLEEATTTYWIPYPVILSVRFRQQPK